MPVSYDSTVRLASPETGLKVRNCNERSTAMLLLQLLVRPARPSLVKPGPAQPAGSPRLNVPGKMRKRCLVGERKVNDIWLYDVTCKPGKQKQPSGSCAGPTENNTDTNTSNNNNNNTNGNSSRTNTNGNANGNRNNANGNANVNGDNASKAKKHIYYFAGGGWQSVPSSHHWSLVAELARRLGANATVTVTLVSCPLAPSSPAAVALPQLRALYDTLMRESADKGERAVLAGDSSGGNLVLSLATWSASGEGSGIVPAAVMAICPVTDLRHAEPQMHAVARKDPLQTMEMLESTARAWCRGSSRSRSSSSNGNYNTSKPGGSTAAAGERAGEGEGQWGAAAAAAAPLPPPPPPPLTTADDPALSPLLAPLEPLAAKKVRIHGVTASHDLLAPEAVLFRERCREAGVAGEWLDWDKQMHCFPLAFRYGLRESVQGMAWVVDVLDRT